MLNRLFFNNSFIEFQIDLRKINKYQKQKFILLIEKKYKNQLSNSMSVLLIIEKKIKNNKLQKIIKILKYKILDYFKKMNAHLPKLFIIKNKHLIIF